MQLKIDRQQANECNETQGDGEVKIMDFPFFTKFVFVHVDKRDCGRRASDFIHISDLENQRTVGINAIIW